MEITDLTLKKTSLLMQTMLMVQQVIGTERKNPLFHRFEIEYYDYGNNEKKIGYINQKTLVLNISFFDKPNGIIRFHKQWRIVRRLPDDFFHLCNNYNWCDCKKRKPVFTLVGKKCRT
jgi:hypothetical protein